MRYIGFGSPHDKDVTAMVKFWITQAGGKIHLADLEQKFRKEYRFFDPIVLSPEEWVKNRVGTISLAYRLDDDDMVSFFTAQILYIH